MSIENRTGIDRRRAEPGDTAATADTANQATAPAAAAGPSDDFCIEHKDSARLYAVQESVIDAIITINQDGLIESVNRATCNLFKYERSELIGLNVSILMPNPYSEQHDGYLKHYLETGQKKIIGVGREVTARRKDGSVFPAELSIAEVHFQERRLFAGVLRDITGRKQTEAELEQHRTRLKQLVQERTTELEDANQKLRREISDREKSDKKVKKLTSQLLSVQEEERQRVAKDLHDSVAQFISAAKLNFITYSKDPARFQSRYELGIEFLDKASGELREIYTGLFPSILDDLGLQASIRWYARHYLNGIDCEITYDVNRQIGHQSMVHLYRIVQEALANILKHSGAERVKICLHETEQDLMLQIVDNGRGFDTNRVPTRSFGLANMRERAAILKGGFEINSSADGGTHLKISIPLKMVST